MEDRWYCVQAFVTRLEDSQAPPPPPEDRFYAWNSLPLDEFFTGAEAARDELIVRNRCWTGEERFLDVGSGIGSKLLLASRMGFAVEGIERHEPYADASRALFPELPVTVCEAADFDGYGDFDVVYSFRLCVDLGDQDALTRLIASRMRPGALLFHAGGPDPDWLERVAEQVWVV